MSYEHLARWGQRDRCPRCGSPLVSRESNINPATGGQRVTRCTQCAYEIIRQTTPAYNPF
jgi:DNA-directed RNA polymerase subunit M/transcription elongation factor TFIIS